MLDSPEPHILSPITPPSDAGEVKTHKKSARDLESNRRWYYSEKGQVAKAQLAERRRLEYHFNKAVRNAEEDLEADKIAGLCAIEIERRQAVLDAAIRAREKDKAQRPKPGPKARPKGTAAEEVKRQQAMRLERDRRRRAKVAAEREQRKRQDSDA